MRVLSLNVKIRKLNLLCGRLENEITDNIFLKWMKMQTNESSDKVNPVAVKTEETLASLAHDKTFRLRAKGYIIKRSKSKRASGFAVIKVE
jgi:hypothetical protein